VTLPRTARYLAGAPWIAALPLVGAWLVINPPSADLADALYRAHLFDHAGWTLWDNQWYAGISTLDYSVLFPPLGALFGPRLLGALAAVASAWLFARVAERHFGPSGWLGAWWFSAAVVTMLMSGRLTFALGVSIGLAAFAVALHGRPVGAGVLAGATSLASPVAGAFVMLAGGTWLLTGGRNRGLALLLGAGLPLAVLDLVFPQGGAEPFTAGSLAVVIGLSVVAVVILGRRERSLAIGVGLYAVTALVLFLVQTPMGENVTRLGSLFGGPVLACVIGASVLSWQRKAIALVVVMVPFVWWQWARPVLDVAHSWDDPTANRAYFAPLLGFLKQHDRPPGRLEVVPLVHHWEATYVAPHYPLARGWERQLDTAYATPFYSDHLSAASYRRWLDGLGVRYVALSNSAVDSAAVRERDLIERGLPYLRPVFRSADWRVYAVRHPRPLASGAARMEAMGPDYFDLVARAPGSTRVRVRYTPYWSSESGRVCVEPTQDGWTRVLLQRAGETRVDINFSLSKLVEGDARCRP
jgi:hypothetical protein